MVKSKSLPEIVERMTHSDFILALLYLKPGSASIHEEAFAYGFRKVAEEYPQLHEKGFFKGRSSQGSCGSTHNTLDLVFDGLHSFLITYTPSYQYSRLTAIGKDRVQQGLPQDYGLKTIDELRPFAQEVWQLARSHQSMYNRPQLYG